MKICKVEDCLKNERGKSGLCGMHYARKRRNGDPLVKTLSKPKPKKECKIEGCIKDVKCKGMCNTHYACFKRTGDPIAKIKAHNHKICTVDNCNNPHRRNGYCSMHSSRVRRYDNVSTVFPGKMTEEERLIALKKSQRKYQKTEKGKIANRLKRQRRRHLKKSDVKLNSEQTKLVYSQFNNKCFNCKTNKDLTMDHHVPLVAGGKLELGNVVLLCRSCNGYKSDIDPKDYYDKEKLEEIKKALENQSLLVVES